MKFEIYSEKMTLNFLQKLYAVLQLKYTNYCKENIRQHLQERCKILQLNMTVKFAEAKIFDKHLHYFQM